MYPIFNVSCNTLLLTSVIVVFLRSTMTFYDNVVIKGCDFSTNVSNICRILSCIREALLTLNSMKCTFFRASLPYLGYIIDNGNICNDPEGICIICNMYTPSNAKSLEEFLEMTQFCNQFISHLSTIAALLHALAKPSVAFQWIIECQTAFDRIKYMLTKVSVLNAPQRSDFFILETDSCDKGEGACVKVCSNTKETEHLVAYTRRMC